MDILYDKIGKQYNNTRLADSYLISRLLHMLQAKPDEKFLDAGCGTGNYTIALAKSGLNFTGVEPSEKMLSVARATEPRINWLKGFAEEIPVSDKYFNGAIATLTIHHWQNIFGAFKELARVLKSGAKLVLFTATPVQMQGYWLNHYFPEMIAMGIRQMPSMETISSCLSAAGFKVTFTEKYFVQDNLQDLFLYSGKNKPEIYFDSLVRSGISSFAAISNVAEVNAGLSKLRRDIQTEIFAEVSKSYENDNGDYIFICSEIH